MSSQDGFKYDSFILIRPDGIFQTIPDITKKQALISLFKEVSKKNHASVAVNNPYPNVSNETKYFLETEFTFTDCFIKLWSIEIFRAQFFL